MITSLPNLYLITDRHQVGTGKDLLGVIEELLQAGVRMVQLREKDLSSAELYLLAKQLRLLTSRYDTLLLINDRIDLALAVNADGVHLGQHSMPISIARQLLGNNKLIGASTHSTKEAESAQQQGANFITYGPIFYTPSKAPYGDPVGLGSLRNICQTSKLPIYALGGIKADNAKEALNAGAHGVAMISALLSTAAPAEAYQQFNKILL